MPTNDLSPGRALPGKRCDHPERSEAAAERIRKPALGVIEVDPCAEIAFASDRLFTQVDSNSEDFPELLRSLFAAFAVKEPFLRVLGG
jgi:hypothetical protein